jgi:C-terminal processing protease CtpA/Prc
LKIPDHLSSSSAEIVAATLKMDEIAKILKKENTDGAIFSLTKSK